MNLTRGGTVTKDVGIFLNARHLLALAQQQRTPKRILGWIDVATTRLLLGGSASYQVIVADCANFEERRVAEEFALQAGFLVRHAPAGGPSPSTILTSEILRAVSKDVELRVVIVGDSLLDQQAAFDALHQMKRWIVLLSKEWSPNNERHADLVINLPLDREPLLLAMQEAVRRLGEEPDLVELRLELAKEIPGFSPAMFGFDDLPEIVRTLRKRIRKEGRLVEQAPQLETPIAKTVPARKRSRPNVDPERASARSLVLRLPVLEEVEAATLRDIDVAARLLPQLLNDSTLVDYCQRRGLDFQLFIDGLRHITRDSAWRPTDSDSPAAFPALMHEIASITPGWAVGLPPERRDLHLLRCSTLPATWVPYTPPDPDALNDTVDPADLDAVDPG